MPIRTTFCQCCPNFQQIPSKVGSVNKKIASFRIIVFRVNICRWEADPETDGPFPIVFNSVEKTLNNHRSVKFSKAPKHCREIHKTFEDPVLNSTFCNSFHKEKYRLYDTTYSSNDFGYCVYSSKKTINLISRNVPENERFLLMDATFSITPNRMFYQVLIIYARYFEKVRHEESYIRTYFYINFFFILPDISAGLCNDDSKDSKSV